MSKLNSFDRVAPFYDVLAHVVFAGNIKRSQLTFLDVIESGNSILIIGGGTGWIVKEIFKREPDVMITYVEGSAQMIEMTKKRLTSPELNRVHFIHTIELPRIEKVDVVITNFLLDVFSNETLPDYIIRLKQNMKPQTLWLVTDFVNEGRLWQRFLLRTMNYFFLLTGSMGLNALPDWNHHVYRAGFTVVKERKYFSDFIKAAVYRPST